MKRALALLAEHRETRAVATKLGYQSPASFINAFKKVHSMLPSAWLAALEGEPAKAERRKAGKRRRSRYYRILGQLDRLTVGERRRIAEVCLRMNGVGVSADSKVD